MSSFSRVLKLLLAGNLLLGAWFFMTSSSVATRELVLPPVLLVHKREVERLSPRLSHVVSAQISEDLPGLPEGIGGDDPGYSAQCLVIGPLNDSAPLVGRLDELEVEYDIREWQEPDMANPYYRAHTPAFESREVAITALEDIRISISRSGASIDSYIVTTGSLENAISLGLFSERDNALNVQRILASQDINVIVEPEMRLISSRQVVMNHSYYNEFKEEIDALLVELSVGPGVIENLCETIAQAE